MRYLKKTVTLTLVLIVGQASAQKSAVDTTSAFGSANSNVSVVENYNAIVAPDRDKPANIISGITLRNNTASDYRSSQNSPALTFSATSWNPTTR